MAGKIEMSKLKRACSGAASVAGRSSGGFSSEGLSLSDWLKMPQIKSNQSPSQDETGT